MLRTSDQLTLLVLILLIGCGTSRVNETNKENYAIAYVICERIDDPTKKPVTRNDLEQFVIAARDNFAALKNRGEDKYPMSLAVYSKAVVLADRIDKKDPSVTMMMLQQFAKEVRDVYKSYVVKEKPDGK